MTRTRPQKLYILSNILTVSERVSGAYDIDLIRGPDSDDQLDSLVFGNFYDFFMIGDSLGDRRYFTALVVPPIVSNPIGNNGREVLRLSLRLNPSV